MERIECALCDRPAEVEQGDYAYCREHYRKLFPLRWLSLLWHESAERRRRRRSAVPAH